MRQSDEKAVTAAKNAELNLRKFLPVSFVKKFLRYCCMFSAGLTVVLTGLFYYLLGTTDGARFACNTASEQLDGIIVLDVEITGGNILGGLSLGKTLVEVPDIVRVEASSLSLRYDVVQLLSSNVFDVSYLHSKDLSVTLLVQSGDDEEPEDFEEPSEDEEPFRLNFPVDIRIHDFKVENFAYLSEQVDVHLDSLQAYLQAAADTALLKDGKAVNTLVELKNSSEDAEDEDAEDQALAKAGSFEAPSNESFDPSLVDAFGDGGGIIELLPAVNLPLDVMVAGLELHKARYFMEGFDTGEADLSLSASWAGTRLSVLELKCEHEMGKVKIAGLMDFQKHFYMQFDLEGEGAVSDYNAQNFEGLLNGLKGKARVQGDLVDLSAQVELENPDLTILTARINCLSPNLPVAVTLESDYLCWPLFVDAPQAEVYDLHFESIGTLFGSLKTSLHGSLSGYGFENYYADISADVALDHALVHNLSLEGKYLGSAVRLNLKGILNYGNEISYDGELAIKGSNAGFIDAMLKGPFNIALKSNAAVILDEPSQAPDLNVKVSVNDLNASLYLNGVPAKLSLVNAQGDLNSGFEIEDLHFVQADNEVRVKGKAGESSDLNADIALNDLTKLYADLEGSFNSKLKVSGSLEDGEVSLRGKLADFRFGQSISMRSLILDANVKTLQRSFSLTTVIQHLRASGLKSVANKCMIDFSGTLGRHGLMLTCDTPNQALIGLTGGYDQQQKIWQGQLRELFVRTPQSGSVSLMDAADLTFDADTLSGTLGAMVLRGENGALNFEKTSFAPGNVETGLNFKDYQLQSLNDLMPESVRLGGAVSLDCHVLVDDGNPDISLKLSSSDARVFAYGIPFMFDEVSVNAKVQPQAFNLESVVNMRHDRGRIELDVKASDPMDKRTLSGTFRLDAFDLAVLSGLGTQFNDLQGKADIDGTLGGDLANPMFYGTIKASGSAEPRLDVGQVDAFSVQLTSKGSNADLAGTITLNGGQINLDGNLDWSEGANGRVHAKAERLPVFLMGFGQAHANVDASASFAQTLDVSGRVEVPSARIRVSNVIDSGATPSSDEIIVPSGGYSQLIEESSSPTPMNINLNVTLGNDVKVDAMGLTANLDGAIDIKQTLGERDIKGYGQVSVRDGKADLFGHRFIVNKALTRFNGQIADPALDVEIVADPDDMEDDVVAGIKVAGTASDPRIELFSEPAMSDNETLSYILYGHGLEKNASFSQDNNSSSQLLLGLGLSSSTGVVNALVGAFGVQSVQFGATGSGEDTAVEVQGYITRKIRISYGYGVFNAVSEFKLRYEIIRKLYAEFVSSVDQAVDLIYSFEFD